jgi:DNA polymerase V
MIAIVDCNNFYASCERVFNPKLEKKPVVVLSNNDGCVIARSEEAKKVGIQMGHPAFQAEEIFKKHNVQVFSSNYALYGDMSDRVYNTLSHFVPDAERYSIDEAFLNLDSLEGNFDMESYCSKIRSAVKQWIGIPVSIGVAATKTLSKIANKIVKKKKLPSGILILDTEEKINVALQEIDVEDIWGVGRQYAKLLKQNGYQTAYDFKNANPEWVNRNMTVVGLRTLKELNGEPCIEMEYVSPTKKGICTSRCFGKPVFTLEELKEALTTYTTRCAEKLRQEKLNVNVLTVFVHTNPFKANTQQYSSSAALKLDVPTNLTPELVRYAIKGLERIYKKDICYYKAGIMATNLTPENAIQGNLFDNENRDFQKKLMKVLDKVNSDLGSGKIRLATEGFNKKWTNKREKLSPCYTTRWKDLINIYR